MHDSRRCPTWGWFWLGLAVVGGLARPALAQPTSARVDPVAQLREALREPVTEKKEDLDARQKALAERIRGLRTIGDLQRALLLTDWLEESLEPGVSAVDRKARNEVVQRLVDSLRTVLEKATPANQWAAANVIGELSTTIRETGSQQSVTRRLAPDLAKLLQDGTPQVREAAARALSNITPDPEVGAPALGKALKAESVTLRRAAASGLGNLIQRSLQLIEGKGRSTTGVQTTWPDVLQTAAAVVPQAATGLQDKDTEVRRLSTEAIGQAAYALFDYLFEPAKNLRASKGFEPPKGLDDKRRREDLRPEKPAGASLEALIKALHDQAPQLAQVLSDPDARIRLQARRALENIADARRRLEGRGNALPPLPGTDRSKTEPPLAPNQHQLLQALQINLDNLKAGVKDPSDAVRLATVEVLELMGDAAMPAGPELVQALGDRSIFVCWVAARALGRMSKPIEVETAVPALARLLEARDLDLRIQGALTLERYGRVAQAAIPALVRTVGRGDPEIRIAAIHALETVIKDPEPGVPAVAAALQDPNSRVRLAAAETLAQLGELARGAVEPLRQALADPEPDVRRAASEALLSIVPTTRDK